MNPLVALQNVSAPCVTTDPCTCPVYGPGGVYQPTPTESGYVCWLALEVGPAPLVAAPVPALDSWALVALVLALAVIGARRA